MKRASLAAAQEAAIDETLLAAYASHEARNSFSNLNTSTLRRPVRAAAAAKRAVSDATMMPPRKRSRSMSSPRSSREVRRPTLQTLQPYLCCCSSPKLDVFPHLLLQHALGDYQTLQPHSLVLFSTSLIASCCLALPSSTFLLFVGTRLIQPPFHGHSEYAPIPPNRTPCHQASSGHACRSTSGRTAAQSATAPAPAPRRSPRSRRSGRRRPPPTPK